MSAASGFAPASTSACATATWLLAAAQCSGVSRCRVCEPVNARWLRERERRAGGGGGRKRGTRRTRAREEGRGERGGEVRVLRR